jgi:hypothetical protein
MMDQMIGIHEWKPSKLEGKFLEIDRKEEQISASNSLPPSGPCISFYIKILTTRNYHPEVIIGINSPFVAHNG